MADTPPASDRHVRFAPDPTPAHPTAGGTLRHGRHRLSLFTAGVIVPDLELLPLLCVAALPAWLIVTGRPEMVVRPEPAAA
ncbi:hypothetical protein KCMC57_up24320 [Kitasatospora sp. CMC57]|uniref:Uncharacterized protein n=1 Tax=Kitasatospora sp. CMC57 TaxID=3231513 RepID=A0AB33K0F2_9ACTN